MPLTPHQLSAVIRLEGAAAEVLASARAVQGHENVRIGYIGRTLAGVISQARAALQGEEELRSELEALFPEPGDGEIFWRHVEPRAAALVGWLRGVVAAESLEMRITAEAAALADARIRAERGIGFRASEEAG